MKISTAEFVTSNTDYRKCPVSVLPEFAFIGRSNVGKSSLINMLLNRKGLAKTSINPGKTQTINHFKVNEKWYIVDLPGYGFARVSRATRAKWETMIYDYLRYRKNLISIFVLIDSRIEPQKNDLKFINGLGENRIPFSIVFTKTDKLTKTKTQNNVSIFCRELLNAWETLPPYFISSAKTMGGRKEILDSIEKEILDFNPDSNRN